MNVIVMGVCGCGKTTVGRALADELEWQFLDADDFHPPANVAKMAAGSPLADEDRWPWLDRLREELVTIARRGDHAVLACSALKRTYRRRLAQDAEVRFVYLKGEQPIIASRLQRREGHYMPPSLLESQFAALEEPDDALVIDVALPVKTQVEMITRMLSISSAER